MDLRRLMALAHRSQAKAYVTQAGQIRLGEAGGDLFTLAYKLLFRTTVPLGSAHEAAAAIGYHDPDWSVAQVVAAQDGEEHHNRGLRRILLEEFNLREPAPAAHWATPSTER